MFSSPIKLAALSIIAINTSCAGEPSTDAELKEFVDGMQNGVGAQEPGDELGTGGTAAASGGAPFDTSSGGASSGSASSGGSGSGGSTGVDGTGGGTSGNSCEGVRSFLSESDFNQLFPNRNSAYTYEGMLDAIEGEGDLVGFPLFAAVGDCDSKKRELAAFLANVARETGQLVYIEQIDKSFVYCDPTQSYGCPAGANSYFGRGPIQISWNYNYKSASEFLFGDDRLLQKPSLVAEDPAVAWSVGFWFWMIGGDGGDGSYSPHSVMTAGQGLGATINIINGYEECNGGTVDYASEAVSQRVCYYEKYTSSLNVSVGSGNLNCGTATSVSYCQGI